MKAIKQLIQVSLLIFVSFYFSCLGIGLAIRTLTSQEQKMLIKIRIENKIKELSHGTNTL